MVDFETNSDLVWATLNQLVRESLNFEKDDPAFEIGAMVMNQLVLEENAVLKTVWNCADSSGSGGLIYYRGTGINSVKNAYDACLNQISKDDKYKEDQYLIEKIKQSSEIKKDSYDKLIANGMDILDIVKKWRAETISYEDCNITSITNAEGKVTNISASGHFGGDLNKAPVTASVTVDGSVHVVNIGSDDKPGKDVWMTLTSSKSQIVPIDRSNWFDYDYLTLCLRNLSDDVKEPLKKYWADPEIDVETGKLKKQAGVFRYIPSDLVLWQGIQLQFGFTIGKGIETEVDGTIRGKVSVLGLTGIDVTGKAHVLVSDDGTKVTKYEFNSGPIKCRPFIAGVIVEPCDPESIDKLFLSDIPQIAL